MSKGGGGSSGGSTTTVQKADPWSGVQPYLTSAYSDLSKLYQGTSGPQYFPGSTIAPLSPLEAQGNQEILSRMQQLGTPLGDQAFQNLINMSSLAGTQGNLGFETAYPAIGNLQSMAGQASGGIGGMQDIASILRQQALGGTGGMPGAESAMERLAYQAGMSSQGAGGTVNAMQNLLGYGNMGPGGPTWTGTGGITNAMQQLAAAGDPANNPYFQQAVQTAIRPVQQQFQEQVLPGIRQGAQAAGQMGSSRQGVAEGIATRGYMDTLGDITSQMGNQAYAQGLQALQASGGLGQALASMGLGAAGQAGALGSQLGQLNLGQLGAAGNIGLDLSNLMGQQLSQAGGLQSNLAGMGSSIYGNLANLGSGLMGAGQTGLGQAAGLVPKALQSAILPGQTTLGIGQQATADAQRQIDADMARWNYEQQLPYSMISDYLQLLQGAPGGTTSSTMNQSGGSTNRLMSGLGGAMTGYGIGSAFGPMGGLIGGLGGGLFGLF